MRLTWPIRGPHLLLLAGVALGHVATLQAIVHPAKPVATEVARQAVAYRVRTLTPPAALQDTLSSPAPAAPSPAAATPPGENTPQAGYLPAHQLDWPALPRSAPDTTLLDGQALSGLPLTLRLYIDARGRVTTVDALVLADDDRPALPALQAMFRATAYSPGRRQGRDVASYVDLALGVAQATADDTSTVPTAAAPWQHAAAH